MMSLDTIRSMSRQQARRSAAEGRGPLVVEYHDTIDKAFLKGIPHLGDRTPKGWKKVFLQNLDGFDYRYEELFCDASGFGAEWEPALTHKQLCEKLGLLQAIFPDGFALSISEVGQFQVHIRVMVPTGSRRSS